MDARRRRVGRNEALFREVNERIKEINEGFGLEEEADFICECADEECTTRIVLTRSEYEQVRAASTRFAVFPGHDVADAEHVLAGNERFTVVEKFAEAGSVASGTDPRR